MNEKSALPSAPVAGQKFDPPPPYSQYSPYPSEPTEPTAQSIGPGYPVLPPQSVQLQPIPQPVIQPAVIQVVHTPPNLTILGPESVRLTCPHCQAEVSTRVDKEPSIAAYVSAAILFILGCVCGCCLIPFCMDSCKATDHYCANCKRHLGRYSKY